MSIIDRIEACKVKAHKLKEADSEIERIEYEIWDTPIAEYEEARKHYNKPSNPCIGKLFFQVRDYRAFAITVWSVPCEVKTTVEILPTT